MARFLTQYREQVVPQLVKQFGYQSVMEVPRIAKITLNMGVGEAKTDAKALDSAIEELTTIAGQRARRSFEARFSWDFEAKSLLSLYERIIRERGITGTKATRS